MKRIVLVLIGPQGSGKGTQAQLLASEHDFAVIEMGALLRKEAELGTPLGQKVKEAVTHGDLVSEELTLELIKRELGTLPIGKPIVFDGFPRMIEQAKELDAILEVTKAVNIEVPYEVSIKRITGRLMCPHGHNYNTFFVPSSKPGICNVDHLPLHKREDDTEEAVKKRLALYHEVTEKVIGYYQQQHKVVQINGDASIFAVSHEIKTKVLQVL